MQCPHSTFRDTGEGTRMPVPSAAAKDRSRPGDLPNQPVKGELPRSPGGYAALPEEPVSVTVGRMQRAQQHGKGPGPAERLLNWYRKNGRTLPWRSHPTPYRIWISEIMLQQTQVATVIPYYERFIARFPDIPSLAAASEKEVLALWSGLGYYRRARNILRAAREIAAEGGIFPRDFEKILSLPGIGRYTAGAICSIAYNEPRPAVDGNIRRVVARLEGKQRPLPESFFYRWMKAWMPPREASSFLQAMMDLGSTVCFPKRPDCPRCPESGICAARRLGIQDRIPPPGRKRPPRNFQLAILVLKRKGRILLRAMDEDGFIPGRWGLPFKILADGDRSEDDAASQWLKRFGRAVTPEFRGRVRHGIGDRVLQASVFGCEMESDSFRLPDGMEFRWASRRSLDWMLTSSLFRKALQCAGHGRPETKSRLLFRRPRRQGAGAGSLSRGQRRRRR